MGAVWDRKTGFDAAINCRFQGCSLMPYLAMECFGNSYVLLGRMLVLISIDVFIGLIPTVGCSVPCAPEVDGEDTCKVRPSVPCDILSY